MDKLVVTYKDRNIIINARLLDEQNCWDRLEEIKQLHLDRMKLEENMTKADVSAWTALQFELQRAWGFPVDAKYHAFWYIPGCECPQMDNNERYPTGYYVINKQCPLHGGL